MKMKTKALHAVAAIGLSALITGSASAQTQTATSLPVGYETLELQAGGLNVVGLRLHEKAAATGQLETVTADSVIDTDINLADLMDGSMFILEISDPSGTIVEVNAANTTADGLSVNVDLTGLGTPLSYVLRPAATLASVFGNDASSIELGRGNGSIAGADQVWLWNPMEQVFVRYYFDNFGGPGFDTPTWQISGTTNPVDGNNIPIVYTDGFIIESSTGNDVVVSGAVKPSSSALTFQPAGLTFVSSVTPVNSTLDVLFGTTAGEVNLEKGNGSIAGADQVWVWNVTDQNFTRYYFDNFGGPGFDTPTWQIVGTTTIVDASTIELGSGYVVESATGSTVTQRVPEFFDRL